MKRPAVNWAPMPRYGGQLGLTPLEEAILIGSGHLPMRPFTNEEVAAIMGFSKQYIGQITQQALEKLRSVPALEEAAVA